MWRFVRTGGTALVSMMNQPELGPEHAHGAHTCVAPNWLSRSALYPEAVYTGCYFAPVDRHMPVTASHDVGHPELPSQVMSWTGPGVLVRWSYLAATNLSIPFANLA